MVNDNKNSWKHSNTIENDLLFRDTLKKVKNKIKLIEPTLESHMVGNWFNVVNFAFQSLFLWLIFIGKGTIVPINWVILGLTWIPISGGIIFLNKLELILPYFRFC